MTLNFFERPKKRKIYLIGEKGSLKVCFNSQKIIIFKNKKKLIKKFNFKKNDIFIKEIKYFVSKSEIKNKNTKKLKFNKWIKNSSFCIKIKSKFFTTINKKFNC